MKTLETSTLVVSPFGVIEAADARVCDLLGYSRSELIGLHGSELVLPADQPETAMTLDRMRKGEVRSREANMRRKDGTLIAVEVRGVPMANSRLALTLRALA